MKNSCKKIFGFLTAVIVTASLFGCTTEKPQNIGSETSTENSADTTEATEEVTEKATEKATDAPKNTVKRVYNELFPTGTNPQNTVILPQKSSLTAKL